MRLRRVHLGAMSPGVVAALITAGVSLLLSLAKIGWDERSKRAERQLAAREKLDRYRAPLLAAADDLGRCLHNIRNESFLAYLDLDDRRIPALQTTLFRLAQYLGWTEIVYGYSDRLRFERHEATKTVAMKIGEVGRILATDTLDRADEEDFRTSSLMLWRDEQRAIGELMRQDGDEPRCMGFASFVKNYDESFSRWFATFARDLEGGGVEGSARLENLHTSLADLVLALDVDRVLVELDRTGEHLISPEWAAATQSA